MKIETKNYANGREVVLIAEAYGTKIYQDINNVDQFYVASYDDVIASIFKDNINIEANYQKHELL